MEELERLLAVETGGDELGADEYLSDKSFYLSDSENAYSLCFYWTNLSLAVIGSFFDN